MFANVITRIINFIIPYGSFLSKFMSKRFCTRRSTFESGLSTRGQSAASYMMHTNVCTTPVCAPLLFTYSSQLTSTVTIFTVVFCIVLARSRGVANVCDSHITGLSGYISRPRLEVHLPTYQK